MPKIKEDEVEQHALTIMAELGYARIHGPDIGPEGSDPEKRERQSHKDVILIERLLAAIGRFNPNLPEAVRQEVAAKVTQYATPDLIDDNRQFHAWLCDGVPVEYSAEGEVKHDKCRLIDFDTPSNNDWAAVNQFTVIEKTNRRPDIVVFLNGLPIAVIELKNAADAKATIETAFHQLQTYKDEIRSLFAPNVLLMVADGPYARFGSLSAGWTRFAPWRTIDGERIIEKGESEMEVMLQGLFAPATLLQYLRRFIVFEQEEDNQIIKKIAGYHQYHAVRKAVKATMCASSADGDRRIGVVWHTQGSGKSLSMVFFSGSVVAAPEMSNPTIVVVTDRQDLDGQLHGTFSRCSELLKQTPEQAESCKDLMDRLSSRAAGGIIFTTMQKFSPEDGSQYPMLSDRRNIVVVADEAHRSQYGFAAKYNRQDGEESYGYAKYLRDALPNASFIGFTGTPIDFEDKSTQRIFGDYIDIYDIERAVEDGATVRIYYESRLAKLELPEEMQTQVDDEFEEVMEGEEEEEKERFKSQWSTVEKVVGTEQRLRRIAADIDQHFEGRTEAIDGKAMVVCMSRRICVDMYRYLTELHPEWHDDDPKKGAIKVIMTAGASDPEEMRRHAPSKQDKKLLENRVRDPDDPLKIVIVCDMWLTGFDAPCLHTMYIDKPMKGHNLMQAIARVNRVFRDKEGGLIVDYIGIAGFLKKALKTYSDSGGKGAPTFDQQEAIDALMEQIEVVRGLMHGFDYMRFFELPQGERLSILPNAMEHILKQEDGKKRYLDAVARLTTAFSLAMPREEAIEVRKEVALFQSIKAVLVKSTVTEARSTADVETAIRQIISRAVGSDEIMDIFGMAGIDKPDVSILSDEFLAEVQNMEQKNLALEALRRLLQDEIKTKLKNNVVQQRSFFEMLNNAIKKYTNRALTAAEIVNELIELAKQFNEAVERGESEGMTASEVAFFDALAKNESAVDVLGDEKLKALAVMLVEKVRASASIDWTIKESVRAQMRNIVKRLLRQFGYPPDRREEATRLVLEQAEALARDWADGA